MLGIERAARTGRGERKTSRLWAAKLAGKMVAISLVRVQSLSRVMNLKRRKGASYTSARPQREEVPALPPRPLFSSSCLCEQVLNFDSLTHCPRFLLPSTSSPSLRPHRITPTRHPPPSRRASLAHTRSPTATSLGP